MEYWFWLLLYCFIIIWYLLVTIFVTFRGAQDIRKMIANERNKKSAENI